MLESLLNGVHVFVCGFLILVVLLQQGRGGGLAGGATAQVFGGRGAGNFMTRLTGICAAVFMLTSMSLAYMCETLQRRLPVQGNLDPLLLVAGGLHLERRVREILDLLSSGPFVFNLGHGILPDTPPEHVARLVELVKGKA